MLTTHRMENQSYQTEMDGMYAVAR
jgi:hypothetical protein